MGLRVYNFDAEMVLKDAGLVAASAGATVGGQAKIIDVGNARMDGVVVVDVSALETDSSNERFDVILQGSTVANFASDVENLAILNLGHSSARLASGKTSPTGRYEMPFTNKQASLKYRYLRLYIVVAGTVGTGINFKAFIAPMQGA